MTEEDEAFEELALKQGQWQHISGWRKKQIIDKIERAFPNPHRTDMTSMTPEEIIEMAKQAGFERLGHTDNNWVCYPEDLEAFAGLVRADEREACAKVADEYANGLERNYSEIIADLIRARGQA